MKNGPGRRKDRMYTFDSRIRYSETDADLMLTPEALVDYFQDCSTFQSEDLGVGLSYLGERHMAWLVNFWQLDVFRYPKLGETIRTGTSPYRIRGFMGNRNFLMETTEGETLVKANSVWSLMDMEAMVPVRAPQDMLDKYTLYEPFDMFYADRKIAVPDGGGEAAAPLTIGMEHLDSNHHVNNAQYLRFAAAAYAEKTGRPRAERILVEYRRQARLGDVLVPVCYGTGEDMCVELRNGAQEDNAQEVFAVVRFTERTA